MSNAFLNATEYANAMLLLAKQNLVTGRMVDGQFKNQVSDENGLVINVKRPPRFVKGSGATLQAQDIVTGSVNIAVDQYTNVHLSIGDLESVQSFNALMRNTAMQSASYTIASAIDSYLQSKTLGFNGWAVARTKTLDTTKDLPSVQALAAARTRLAENGVPLNMVAGTIADADVELITGAMQTNFTPGLNQSALEQARVPVVSTINWYGTQQVPTLVAGARTGGTLTGAAQNVNYRNVKSTNTQTLNITGAGAGATVEAGAVFTLANVFAWDWRANGGLGAQLPYLQQFTVVNAVTLDGSGAGALTISPPIIVQGSNDGVDTKANTAFATVSVAPATNAGITWVNAASSVSRVRAAWAKPAIAMVSARLQTPFSGVSSFATDPETGISIRYWRGSDIQTGQHIHRFDTIYGAANMDPFMGTRVGGF
jgi:hypothetical protein